MLHDTIYDLQLLNIITPENAYGSKCIVSHSEETEYYPSMLDANTS